MSSTFSVLSLMLNKDLMREWRSREIFLSSFLFSIILLCVFYFSAAATELSYEKMPTAALWICITFSGTIALNRTHQSEAVNGCYRALMMAPVDAGWLYIAKVIANTTLLSIMLALLLPILAVFFHVDLLPNLGKLLASLLLGVTGFTAIGTLVVVVTANTRIKDVLFPIVQLPLVVPILIAGVNSTQAALNGEFAWSWLQFLLVINVVFLSLGFMIYEFLLEE